MKKNQCTCVDDNEVQCQNIMTKKEKEQDGYCIRCAELLSAWTLNFDLPVVFKDPATREF